MDIYAFDPPAPADKGTLHNVAVNSTDAVLQSLLRTDVEQDRWIAGWENHKENLPEDPSQARLGGITFLPCALRRSAILCSLLVMMRKFCCLNTST